MGVRVAIIKVNEGPAGVIETRWAAPPHAPGKRLLSAPAFLTSPLPDSHPLQPAPCWLRAQIFLEAPFLWKAASLDGLVSLSDASQDQGKGWGSRRSGYRWPGLTVPFLPQGRGCTKGQVTERCDGDGVTGLQAWRGEGACVVLLSSSGRGFDQLLPQGNLCPRFLFVAPELGLRLLPARIPATAAPSQQSGLGPR